MSTYVMSDIHGCYDELMTMLRKIKFSAEDKLIIAGDYIDRGTQNYEMLKWIESMPDMLKIWIASSIILIVVVLIGKSVKRQNLLVFDWKMRRYFMCKQRRARVCHLR